MIYGDDDLVYEISAVTRTYENGINERRSSANATSNLFLFSLFLLIQFLLNHFSSFIQPFIELFY